MGGSHTHLHRALTLIEGLLLLHDVLEGEHLSGVGGEDGDGVWGVALLQQVATQSHAQLRLVLVGFAARLVVASLLFL